MHPCKGFVVKIVKMVEETKGADENAVKVVEKAKMSTRVRTTCVLWGARDGEAGDCEASGGEVCLF